MDLTLADAARSELRGATLRPLRAAANVAIGERRSRATGAGIEFAQFRKYEPGDDLRHLDHGLFARSGAAWIRQFHMDQRLQVSILLDASASMAVDPESWRFSVGLAAILGAAALNGADQCRFGLLRGDGAQWGANITRHPPLAHEVRRLQLTVPEGGKHSLAQMAVSSLAELQRPGLLILISDWLVEEQHEALQRWRVRGQEIVALQVDSRAGLGAGAPGGRLRLVDAETGETMELRAGPATWRRYREAREAWSEQSQAAVWAAEGRWLSFEAAPFKPAPVVADLRRRGLIS